MSKEPRFYVLAWAGRLKDGKPDMSKHHVIDRRIDSKIADLPEMTGCGHLAAASAIYGTLSSEESTDERHPKTPKELREKVTCKVCKKSLIFKRYEEFLIKQKESK